MSNIGIVNDGTKGGVQGRESKEGGGGESEETEREREREKRKSEREREMLDSS